MEIDCETIPFLPSTVQREAYIIPVDPTDPLSPIDMPRDIPVGHKMPNWDRQSLQEAEGHATPQGTSRERKRPKRFSSYLSAMSHITDSEPSCHGEAIGEHVWEDSMTEEYQSILKNDV
jgi:hypothetical protein